MDVRLAHQTRVESILSTLDKMDGDRGRQKRNKRMTRTLLTETLSSNKKSHAPLTQAKESMLVPEKSSRATDNIPRGKYSAFLSRTVAGDPVTMETKKNRSNRDSRNGQQKSELGHRGEHEELEIASPARSGSTFLEDVKSKDGGYISTPSREQQDLRHVRQPLKLTGNDEGTLSVTSSDGSQSLDHQLKDRILQGNARTKWRLIANVRPANKSQLSKKKLSMGGLVTSKMSSQRRSWNTSGSDTSISEGGEEDSGGMRGPMATISVINATMAFKRQRLKKIQEQRKV